MDSTFPGPDEPKENSRQALTAWPKCESWPPDPAGPGYLPASLRPVRAVTDERLPRRGRDLEQTLAIYRDLGDRGGEATALNETATLHQLSGEPAEAEACHQRALGLARATGSAWDGAHAQPAWAVAPCPPATPRQPRPCSGRHTWFPADRRC
jgi:hypothetical protein